MMKQGWGCIINITGKSEPDRLNAAFSAKAAMHAWAKGLSRDVGEYGTTVNSIPPGRIMSEQNPAQLPRGVSQSHAAAEIPAGAYASQRTLAVMAVFLASPRAHSAGRSFRWMAACGAMRSEPIGHTGSAGIRFPKPA
jgi:3-oxoacyl-[acyl-carrier protein] reductase